MLLCVCVVVWCVLLLCVCCDGGGGRRRRRRRRRRRSPGYRIKNKNPTQRCGEKQRVCDTCGQNTIVQLCGATRCEPPHLVVRRPNDTARVHSMPDSCHHVCGTKCCPKHIQDNLLLTQGHNTWRSLCQFPLFEHDRLQTYHSQAFVAFR